MKWLGRSGGPGGGAAALRLAAQGRPATGGTAACAGVLHRARPEGTGQGRVRARTGLIPLDRGDADAAAAALTTGARAVRNGMLLGVYPEGTRSPDGRLYRGKTGVARMAMSAGAPVAMISTDRVQPIGRVLPRLSRVAVRIGMPLHPPPATADPAIEKRQVREFTERVMAAIATLSGQQRTDVDAAQHKATLRHST